MDDTKNPKDISSSSTPTISSSSTPTKSSSSTTPKSESSSGSGQFDYSSVHDLDESLLEPFRYVNSVPGKDVRGKLIDCFQLWFSVESKTVLNAIKEIVGNLHNASLMIDDIEDNSKLRRGIPVTHSIFGVPATINTANYVYFLALDKVHNVLQNEKATQVFVQELLNLHRGQGHDIQWRDTASCPTEEEYLTKIADKTGGLFRLAVGLLQVFATKYADTDFTNLVNNLAMYFQIRDDFMNLADEEYMKSKSFCEDLTEGKFSLPVIHCIRKDSSDTRLISILKQHTEDIDLKRYAQRILKEAGSLAYTRDKCSELKQKCIQDIEALGGNPPLMQIIQLLDIQLENLTGEVQPPRKVDIDEC
eukprot:CAMPEP_0198137456 /NCGR_PEP_ID=MMETSP1443-20131203/927_1 /TAXON_ID=186043 /ORGANISM="Entomoneis sp., Strain CCMP2396" /LENGTH=361 /DNA_ID=CAMNT_0043798871 /DNA_START=25 /DNA_END=1110 /DNA_ORIENTATION=+